MMDIIAGAYNTLKGAAEIAQGLLTLKTDAAVSAKAVELNRVIGDVQQQLFTVQADHATMAGRIREIEAEIVRVKDWSNEKERYELHELAPGTLTYRVKPSMRDSEPVHDICPNCYEDSIKSILQDSGIKESHHMLWCPRCKSEYRGKRFVDNDQTDYNAILGRRRDW